MVSAATMESWPHGIRHARRSDRQRPRADPCLLAVMPRPRSSRRASRAMSSARQVPCLCSAPLRPRYRGGHRRGWSWRVYGNKPDKPDRLFGSSRRIWGATDQVHRMPPGGLCDPCRLRAPRATPRPLAAQATACCASCSISEPEDCGSKGSGSATRIHARQISFDVYKRQPIRRRATSGRSSLCDLEDEASDLVGDARTSAS